MEKSINIYSSISEYESGYDNRKKISLSLIRDKNNKIRIVDSHEKSNVVTFTAEEAGSTIGLVQLSSYQTFKYTTDDIYNYNINIVWKNMDISTIITLENIGDKVYLSGELSGDNTVSDYTNFKMSGKISASGNCNALWSKNDLNAPLKKYCGFNMFQGCTSLTTAPELPATKLARNCYSFMFQGCTSLNKVQALPATTLAEYCYNGMFYGCSSLTTAPDLPATTLENSCYSSMFYYCSNLNYIKCLATDRTATNCTKGWVSGVASTGTFVKAEDASWSTGTSGIPSGWVSYTEQMLNIDINNFVTFTAEQENSTIGLSKLSSNQILKYRTDSSDWKIIIPSNTITLNNIGDKVYIGGYLSKDNTTSNYTQFKMSGKIAASGNCNALWNKNDLNAPLKSRCGYRMFQDCTSLTTAPELPSTTLAMYCYNSMFQDCTSLTTAPELPATTLLSNCYSSMFSGCTSLTTAPELQATKLASNCYSGMFSNCTSLITAPELPATTLLSNCYSSMFSGCTSLTTAPALPAIKLANSCYRNMFLNCTSLITAPELPATTLSGSCYSGMFRGCTSLTKVPELPAETLENGCYYNMFSGCTSLNTVPELKSTTLSDICYSYMFQNCTSLTTAPKLPATTLADSCYNGMFYGCKSLTTAPELPATTLASYCYEYMFSGCSNLNYIKCLATDRTATYCTNDWVSGVSSEGTFVKAEGVSWSRGVDGFPSGWTVEEV